MPKWNNPTEEEVRKALEEWEGPGNLHMEGVSATRDEEQSIVTKMKIIFDDKHMGDFEATVKQDGTLSLDRVVLFEALRGRGLMRKMMFDFLPHYKQWGVTRLTFYPLTITGMAFAKRVGFKPVKDDKRLWEYEL